MKNFASKTLILIILILMSKNLYSQNFDMQSIPNDNIQIDLKFNKTFWDNGLTFGALNGVFNLSANIPVSNKLNLLVNIPLVNDDFEHKSFWGKSTFKESGLGNLFIGLQTKLSNNSSIISFGLSLPTINEDLSLGNLFSDYYNIQNVFAESFGLYGNIAHHKELCSGFRYGFEIGPNIIIPSGDNKGDTEVFVHYGAKVGYKISSIVLSSEFTGIGILTEDNVDFDERLTNGLSFGASWEAGLITPRVFYKILFKENLSDVMDGILGIGVSLSLDK